MLERAGIEFIQSPADFDEEALVHGCPRAFVYHATEGKTASALKLYGDEVPILCADTVVTADEQILRKPKNRDEARQILLRQSGNSVAILTCTVLHSRAFHLVDLSATTYRFAPFDLSDLERYLQSDRWRDKAGGCMVEGFCKPYIRQVQGLESTALGMTLEVIRPFLGWDV
jgi:septum formation protein